MHQALARNTDFESLACLNFYSVASTRCFPGRFSLIEQPPKILYKPPKNVQKFIFSLKTLEMGKCLQRQQNPSVLNVNASFLRKFR